MYTIKGKKSIKLSEIDKHDIIMFESTNEEVEKLIEASKSKTPSLEFPYLEDLIMWGNIRDITDHVAKQIIPYDDKHRLEPSAYHHDKSIKVTTKEYKCFGRKDSKNIHNNLLVHEDARSSAYCAADCIGRPEAVFILKVKQDDN